MFALKAHFVSRVKTLGSVFISAEQSRRAGISKCSVRDGVLIICEAVKLFYEFRILIKNVRNFGSYSSVEHEYNYVLSVFA